MITSTLTGGAAGGGAAQPTAICPPRNSTGIYPGAGGMIPPPRPGFLPGTFIGPTGIFQGVLNPGIPTMIPVPNVPAATGLSSIVQVTGAPAAATPTTTTTGEAGTTGTGQTLP